MTLLDILKGEGYNTCPSEIYSLIDVWNKWYQGKVADFHSYSVYNGMERVRCERYSMGMAKKVCEDWANLLMNERVKITLEGDNEQKFINGVLKDNNFLVMANQMQELKAAYGTVAYVPRIVGANVEQESGEVTGDADKISIDYVIGQNIFPLSWENGKITECAFGVEKVIPKENQRVTDQDKYLYVQVHKLDDKGEYVIENRLYHNNSGELSEVELEGIKGFENIPKSVNTRSKSRQFVIDRLNIVNNIDYTLPLGVSVFANSIDSLKAIDIAFDSYINEFNLGKRRIMVKPEATKNIDGEPYFDPNDTVFYVLPEDSSGNSIVQPIDMTMRISEHDSGIQDMLNYLSAKCGFGENYYKFTGPNMATATQIVSENSTLFRTVKKHEIILEAVLIELCRILLRLGNTYLGQSLDEEIEISIDFDDSIITDKSQDDARVLTLLQAGLMRPEEARALLMNESEETAKKALPQQLVLGEAGGAEGEEGQEVEELPE